MNASESERPDPLELLYEDVPRAADLPDDLARLYGGALGLDHDSRAAGVSGRLFANFVATVDGAVALTDVPRSNEVICGGSVADRFVMGLLRARADAVLIGADTMNHSPDDSWAADRVYPAAASSWAAYRAGRGQPPEPVLVLLTRTGRLAVDHPALQRPSVVLTTPEGASRLRHRLPGTAALEVPGDRLDPAAAVSALRHLGYSDILTEAGPRLFGLLVAAGQVDDLFLTTAPQFAGRSEPNVYRLIESVTLLPDNPIRANLASIRRAGSHLFTRYTFGSASFGCCPSSPGSDT